ncbi:PREDICTED: uncharacterized protein LOC104781790 [Camelina sativa]|uniref:Uncharacterized protein LOC104781790 n=1 Tax=Camelina sativa TaxID=90675 RepID=A0ABM1RLH4_CAMSA|nr:PREDICTED: uncharacterized protein LOC104781790 [Camelina sativa]
MEVEHRGFSIREYTRNVRSVQVRKCWPFSGDITGDLIHSLLPPITVSKFRWWSHELASLLTKSPPVALDDDDSDPVSRRTANAKSKPCKKRSIVEICAAAPKIQLPLSDDDSDDVLIGSKRKRRREDLVVQTKKTIQNNKSKDSGDRNFVNKVDKCKEESSGVIPRTSNEAGSVSEDHGSEFQIPAILMAKRKGSFVTSPDKSKTQCERHHHVLFSDQCGSPTQLKEIAASLELCCLEMNKLSLSSSEDQSSVADKQPKVMSNDQNSAVMHLKSRQQVKFHQPAVSERKPSHAQAKSDFSCFLGLHLSSHERVKDALDVEREGHLVQPIQSFISTASESPYRSCSAFSPKPASADLHCGTLPYQSPFDPLLVEWMQNSVIYNRQRHVGEAILGFPLNLQGDLVDATGESCRSFDRSGLCTGSSKSGTTENDLLLANVMDFSSEKKHLTEPELAKDSVVHNEKRHKYFPARLGLDETFTEKAYFTNTDDKECGHTVHSPVSEVNPRSHAIDMWKQNSLHRNLDNRNMISKRDGLCLQNSQATMRLMGKDVSVGTSYSGTVRTGERIIAPDASTVYSSLGSHTHQSLLWRRTTLEVSQNYSTTTLEKSWSQALLHDISKDLFPLSCETHVSLASQSRTDVVPNSGFPPTIMNPCCSLASFPWSDRDLSVHGYGLGEPNSFTFSQQQLPFPSIYNNVDIGLQHDARKPPFGLPFSCADSTRRSQAPWPQSSFESSGSGMSFINPIEQQQVSFYGSKSSTYINGNGTTNKRVASSVEEFPMKNHKFPKLPMQGGLNYGKEFFCWPSN